MRSERRKTRERTEKADGSGSRLQVRQDGGRASSSEYGFRCPCWRRICRAQWSMGSKGSVRFAIEGSRKGTHDERIELPLERQVEDFGMQRGRERHRQEAVVGGSRRSGRRLDGAAAEALLMASGSATERERNERRGTRTLVPVYNLNSPSASGSRHSTAAAAPLGAAEVDATGAVTGGSVFVGGDCEAAASEGDGRGAWLLRLLPPARASCASSSLMRASSSSTCALVSVRVLRRSGPAKGRDQLDLRGSTGEKTNQSPSRTAIPCARSAGSSLPGRIRAGSESLRPCRSGRPCRRGC